MIKKTCLAKEKEIQFLTVFYLFSLLLVLPLIPYVKWQLSHLEAFLLAVIGVLALVAVYLFTVAMKKLELSYIKSMENLTPIFVLIFSVLVLGEGLTGKQLVGLLIVVGSALVFMNKEAKIFHVSFTKFLQSRYVIYVIVAVLIGAFTVILDRILLRTMDPLSLLFWGRLIMASGFIGLVFSGFNGLHDIKAGIKISGWLILVYAVMHVAMVYTYNLAMFDPTAISSIVVTIRRLGLILVVIFSARILHERSMWEKLAASVAMIGGLYLMLV